MESWWKLMDERGTRTDSPMKPQVVTYHLNKMLSSDAIVTSDSGTIATWAARYIDIRGDMQFSLSGSLATMANGLPYCIGAAVAYPGRQVVCVVGDGGLSMLMAELATLAKYKLNVKVIVIKNNALGEIKWEQMVMNANPEFGVDLEPIDFAGVARSCGIGGFTLDKAENAEAVLQQTLNYPGPALVEAVVDPNEPPLPGKVKTEQAIHFAEALARGDKNAGKIIETILKDKVREVV
jgi:pyruvate dehydrogenase (quinone)